MNVFELVPDQHSIDLSVQVVSLLTRATYTHDKSKMHNSNMLLRPMLTLTASLSLLPLAGETIQVAEYLVADPTAQVIFKAEAGKHDWPFDLPKLQNTLRDDIDIS
jgi:hypothetical protein